MSASSVDHRIAKVAHARRRFVGIATKRPAGASRSADCVMDSPQVLDAVEHPARRLTAAVAVAVAAAGESHDGQAPGFDDAQ